MNPSSFRVCLVTAILLLSNMFLAAQEQIPNTIFDDVKKDITQWIESDKTPSLSVAVYQDGKLLWLESFGYADIESLSPPHPATSLYPIASITKPFTATAIMMLVEEGKLNLEDPAAKFFEFEVFRKHFPLDREITVKDLLNHTSGLCMYYNNLYYGEENRGINETPAFRKYNDIFYQPGTRFSYSNIGYTILGKIVEKVSGISYQQFLEKRIFAPLKLQNTFVRINKNRIDDYVVLRGAQKEKLPLVYTDTMPAGDIYSSAYDLAQFGRMHLADPAVKSLLTKDTLKQMRIDLCETAHYDDPCTPYGLGWFFEDNNKGPAAFWHEGGLDGAHAMLKMFPGENIVVAVVSNTTFTVAKVPTFVDKIIATLVPEYQSSSCVNKPENIPVTDAPQFQGEWQGKLYTHDGNLDLSLNFLENGEVTASFINQQTRFIFSGNNPFQQKTFLSYCYIADNKFYGWLLDGIIPAHDWNYKNHILNLVLEVKDGKLTGQSQVFDSNKIREGAAATFYLELNRSELEKTANPQ